MPGGDHDARLKELLSVVSHDLRSPLTALLLGARLMVRERALSESAQQVATEMEEAAEELQRRVLDWIDLSRELHGGLSLTPVQVDLADFARGVQREAGRRAQTRGAVLEVRADVAVPVTCDARLLPRMLLALIDHLLQHVTQGARVSVVVTAEGAGGLVRVADSRPLTPAQAAQMFDDLPVTVDGRTVGGISLGLTRTVATRLGGKVWADPAGALLLWLPS